MLQCGGDAQYIVEVDINMDSASLRCWYWERSRTVPATFGGRPRRFGALLPDDISELESPHTDDADERDPILHALLVLVRRPPVVVAARDLLSSESLVS
uniref:Uncharacterized protein n=1 Tax=Anopheles funestus TaxID=62324 RepID=A0A182R9J1_ANOFN